MSQNFSYKWPYCALDAQTGWREDDVAPFRRRDMPETPEQLAADSRWPAFFPSPICLVTTTDGENIAFEKVVGPNLHH